MATKSKTLLLADIAALTPLVTLADLQSILTDMVDSFSAGMNYYTYTAALLTMTEGDITVAHNLGLMIYEVKVTDTDTNITYTPDFTYTDENTIVITWVGDTLNNINIQFLGTPV